MARHRLKEFTDGTIYTPQLVNSIRQTLIGEIVGRNTDGAPDGDQNLGDETRHWQDVYAREIYLNLSLLDEGQLFSPDNAILSGTTRTLSEEPAFLLPVSGSASARIIAFPDSLVVKINGTRISVTSDLTIENLTLAPSANNTCLVNDATLAAQDLSRVHGSEDRYIGGYAANLVTAPSIKVDTMGSSISALVGKWASFKLTHSGSSEYFFAFIESTTLLSHCFRGNFFDANGDPIKRVVVSDNDTITLMKTAWLFLSDDGTTLTATYNPPTWSASTPAAPSTGDYWFDISNDTWKVYNGSFAASDSILIGRVICDATGCVGARSVQFFSFMKRTQNERIERVSASVYQTANMFPMVNVRGQTVRPHLTKQVWDTSDHFAAATDTYTTSVSGSGQYFLYQDSKGRSHISDFEPMFRFDDPGFYHPHHAWRCIGQVQAASGSLTTSFGSFTHRREMGAKHTLSGHIADPAGAIVFGSPGTCDLSLTVDSSDDPLIYISGATWKFMRPGYFQLMIQGSLEVTPLAGAANSPTFNFRFNAGSNLTQPASFITALRREQTPVAAHINSFTQIWTVPMLRPDVSWTFQGVGFGSDSAMTIHEMHLTSRFLGPINR